jgi:hypothetical protein
MVRMLKVSTRPLTPAERRKHRRVSLAQVPMGLVVGPLLAVILYGMILMPLVVLVFGGGAIFERQWSLLWAIPICIGGLWLIGWIITIPQLVRNLAREQRQRNRELRSGLVEVIEGSGEWAWAVCRTNKGRPTSLPRFIYSVDRDMLVAVSIALESPASTAPPTVPSEFRAELLPMSRKILSSRCWGRPIPAFDTLGNRIASEASALYFASCGQIIRRAELEAEYHGVFDRPDLPPDSPPR